MNRRDILKSGLIGAGAAATISSLSAPAIASERIEITMVSPWPRDYPGLGMGAQRFAARLSEMSGGRIRVNYFAGGERVGAFDIFDEVASGNSQMYHGVDYYFTGKHPGFAYFTAVPLGLTAPELNAWLRFGGGQALWDELSAEFGLKGLACGNSGPQMGGWFRKEVRSAADFRGLKMRMPGLGGSVLAKLGGSPVSLPGSQIYENLMSGAIDATEWVGPWNDEMLKLYEAAKFYYYPGFHEPGPMASVQMNKKWWDGLSKSDQALISAAAATENEYMYSEFNWHNGAALARLLNEQGVQLRKFSDDTYDAIAEATEEVFEDVEDHSPLAQRIHQSFVTARAEVGGWNKISDVEYVTQRNRVLGI